MLRPERQVSLSRASLVPCRAKPYDARAMARVRGDGGIFFKSKNPEALRAWYAKHLGIVSEGDQGTGFRWHQADSPAKDNFTAWCIFPASTTYFGVTSNCLLVSNDGSCFTGAPKLALRSYRASTGRCRASLG